MGNINQLIESQTRGEIEKPSAESFMVRCEHCSAPGLSEELTLTRLMFVNQEDILLCQWLEYCTPLQTIANFA